MPQWSPITPELSSSDLKEMIGVEYSLLEKVINETNDEKVITIGESQRVILIFGTKVEDAAWQIYMRM